MSSEKHKGKRSHSGAAAAGAPLGAKAQRVSAGSSGGHDVTGGWKLGQIYRLRLHNFLTFDDVLFLPTPHLNVIVGPNGTGKSSIVCAICIGLGGQTHLLGRAKELKDFVKHSKIEGWVEIELFNERGRNWVIRRVMSSDSNSSSWMLNGREVIKKKIDELTAQLHIQLDNKCQFLPQDMVVEFARMDAAKLLEETEKAIGPKDLHVDHTKLKTLKEDLLKSHQGIREKVRQREAEASQNQLLQRDVERFRNRQNYITQIRHLKMKKCWLEYERVRGVFLVAKDTRRDAVRKYKSSLAEYQPIKVKHEEQEAAVKTFKKNDQAMRDAWRKAMRSVQNNKERLEVLEEELDGPRQELEERKKMEGKRRRKVENLRQEIQAFAHELEKIEEPASIMPHISEKVSRMREVAKEVSTLRPELQRMMDHKEEYVAQMRRCAEELDKMQSVRNQRLSLLQRYDRDTHDAVLWLERNRDQFKQHVFEPIVLNVNVREASYTNQIEAVLAGKDLFSFMTQTREDKSVLLKELSDRKRLKINVVLAPNRAVSDYKPSIPANTLRRYGFAGMILDYIEAPEPQLAFYCQFHGLHNVPLADDLSPSQLERVMHDLKDLRRFFTRDTQYTLIRSRYDRDKVVMKSGKIWPPRYLTASIDLQRKAELEEKIQEAQRSVSVFDEQYSELQKKQDMLHKEDSKLRSEKNQLRLKIDSYKQAQSNMSSRETRLREIENTTFDLKAEEERCEKAMEQVQRKRVEAIKTLQKSLEGSKQKLIDRSKARLLVRGAELKVTHVMYQYRQAKAKIDNAEQEKEVQEKRMTDLKSRVQSLLHTARRESSVQDPQQDQELMRLFRTFPDDLDAVEERIHEYQAQADLCRGIDEEAVREYEVREKKIKRLDDEIKSMDERSKNADEEIETLKQRWLTPLRDLLGKVSVKFSEYFSLMKCVGEVALHEDAHDFSRYSVKISVKFRDSEELQVLNAQRQSGGERSVSTMLYLMSLQGITACPFRVVDEINQGMDPVNERRVFDLIVAATSQGTDASQYFILTPKLLQDLAYTDMVTVHIVHNGQEMPEFKQWNMANFLD